MGKLRVGAQSAEGRISNLTAANEVTATSVAADPVPLTPSADARDFNADFDWETSSGLPTHIRDLVGTPLRDNPVLPQGANTPGTVRWQLDSGAALTPKKGVITYSFLDTGHTTAMYNNPKEGLTEGFDYSPFTAAQRAAARISMQNWDELVAVKFVEVQGEGNADITLANTTTGPAQAHAYTPYDYADIYSSALGPRYNYLNRWEKFLGDVWIATPFGPDGNPSNGQLLPGQYGLQTLNHEIGHSLGLSHPGSYNFSDDTDGDGEPDPITYTGDAQYFQDSQQFTIMSYFGGEETGQQPIDWNVLRYLYPSTPMVDDVFVIQQKYGADMTTRAGNSTYGFNSSADVTNVAMKFVNGEMATLFTIWDAGGVDTLNLSGYYTPSVIDLREGAYSSAGGWGAYNPALLGMDLEHMDPMQVLALVNANNAAANMPNRTAPEGQPEDYFYQLYFNGGMILRNPDGTPLLDEDGNEQPLNEGISWLDITGTGSQYLMEQNIGIAYGAIIENAVGGYGNDRINGNQANNQFTGNAGADTFIIADYSGVIQRPTGNVTINDTSVDKIMDFSRSQGDKIDLSELDVAFTDLSFDNATDTVTVDLGSDTLQFIILGASDIQESDFVF